MGPVDYAPGKAVGAPDHPHRGFETVTYLLAGARRHRDSRGHAGALTPGDVQWMTAGDGVVHSEMPDPEFQEGGGRMHGFQLWVNLPKKDAKTLKPSGTGGQPLNEPIARYGPFVMNTRAEIVEAFEDFEAGRMGSIEPEVS